MYSELYLVISNMHLSSG